MTICDMYADMEQLVLSQRIAPYPNKSRNEKLSFIYDLQQFRCDFGNGVEMNIRYVCRHEISLEVFIPYVLILGASLQCVYL